MRRLRQFLIRLTTSATRRHDEQRLREEIDDHLAFQTEQNLRRGLPPAEARRQAVLAFGSIESVKEDYRDQQGVPVLEHLLQDIRVALRRMRKTPGFTVAAIATLALGLGLTSAVMSLAYALFMRPLPVDDASRLVFVDQTLVRPARHERLSTLVSRLHLLSRPRARVCRAGRALLDVAHERGHAQRSGQRVGQRGHRQLLQRCCASRRQRAASSRPTRIVCPGGIPWRSSVTTSGERDSPGTRACSARPSASTAPTSP